MKWLQQRLREGSTMAGIGTVLMAATQFRPEWGAYAATIAAIVGALAGVMPDPGNKQQ